MMKKSILLLAFIDEKTSVHLFLVETVYPDFIEFLK